MDTCSFNVLHYTRNKDVLSVAYCIYLALGAHKVLIDKYWVLLNCTVDYCHEFSYVRIADSYLHSCTAKYVRRTYKYRIAQFISNSYRILCLKYCLSCCTWNIVLFKYFIKELSIFCCIDILCICTKNRNSHSHKILSKLDGCLSAELNNCSVWLFKLNNALNILSCKRLKIELISYIKVCRYCLRVIIYDNGFPAILLKCPGSMNRAVIEFNTLTDSDRS